MSVPSLNVATQGGNPISADNLNTFQQNASNVANLRTLVGVPGMVVFLQGFTVINDGGEGQFYWNASGTAPDDNGVTTVVPNGGGSGVWTRFGSGSSSTIVNSVTNSDGSLTITPTTGNVVASLGSYAANTALANATASSAQPTGVALTASTILGRGATGNIAAIPYSTFLSQGTYAGGMINKFRNGTFDIWQRGTSGTVTTGNALYTADGWIVGATGATVSWAQSTSLQTHDGNLYSLELTGASSMTDTFIKQRIESAVMAQFASQTVTVQFGVYNALASGTLTPTLTVKHPTAQDNYTSTVTDVSAVSLQTINNQSYAVLSYTFTASSSFNGMEITLDFGAALNSASNMVYLGMADIRVTPGVATGLNSSPPAPELRPIEPEFTFCRRYFQTTYANGSAPGTATTNGMVLAGAGTGSAIMTWGVNFFLPMRVAPSITVYDGAGASGKNSEIAFSGITFTNGLTVSTLPTFIGTDSFIIVCNASSGSYTTFIHYAATSEL